MASRSLGRSIVKLPRKVGYKFLTGLQWRGQFGPHHWRQLHHFTNANLYEGLFTLYDAETHALWNHITGEAKWGRWFGRTLGPPGNLLQVNYPRLIEPHVNPDPVHVLLCPGLSRLARTFAVPQQKFP